MEYPECKPFEDRIKALEYEIRLLQERLASATTAEKPSIVAEIKEKKREKSEAEDDLAACIRDYPRRM